MDDGDGHAIATTCVIVTCDPRDAVGAGAGGNEPAFGGAAAVAWVSTIDPEHLIKFGT